MRQIARNLFASIVTALAFITLSGGNISAFASAHLSQKISLEEAIRLEHRIGIGAPEARVKRYIGLSRKQAIDLIISELRSKDTFVWPDWVSSFGAVGALKLRSEKYLERKSFCTTTAYLESLKAAWAGSMLTSKVPQFERLALFWLDHFSVNADDLNLELHAFAYHLQIIRYHSAGNFKSFLKASLQDPGVIIYLDNHLSTAKNPNENLAREFLELFALGTGNYSEADIRSFAHILAGNGVSRASQKFQIFPGKQNGQPQSAFGQRYQTIDQFIEIVSRQPAFGEFIITKLYHEFVELAPPSKQDLRHLVRLFRTTGFDIPELFRGILSLPRFWSEETELGLVKSPIELVFGTARSLGSTGNDKRSFRWMLELSDSFGQGLFTPPNIAGWLTGTDWIEGQHLLRRTYDLIPHFSATGTGKTADANLASKGRMGEQVFAEKFEPRAADKYRTKRNQFFARTPPMQMAIETARINRIMPDFSDGIGEIVITLYNVKFLSRKWNVISFRLGRDIRTGEVAGKWKYGDYISYHEGRSYPEIIDARHYTQIKDRFGYRIWQSSLPSG